MEPAPTEVPPPEPTSLAPETLVAMIQALMATVSASGGNYGPPVPPRPSPVVDADDRPAMTYGQAAPYGYNNKPSTPPPPMMGYGGNNMATPYGGNYNHNGKSK